MSMHINKPSFGNKGKNKLAASYAEMLLSGEPMERRKRLELKHEPKLKPRRKQAFGRKADGINCHQTAVRLAETWTQKGWKRITIGLFGLATLVALALLAVNANISI